VQRSTTSAMAARAARAAQANRAASRRGNLLVGCLAVLGIVLVLAIVGGIIVFMNWRSWAASGTETLMTAVVEETQLPADQKRRIKAQVSQVTDAFRAGDLRLEEIGEVAQALESHPILPVGMLEFIETDKIVSSSLSVEEKAAGALAVQRLQRAMLDKTMTLADLEPLLEPISQLDQQGDQELLQNPTPPQLRQFIDGATAKADELGVPNEPFEVDIAAQVEDLINSTLGRQVVTTPPPAIEGEGESQPEALPQGGDGDASGDETPPRSESEPADEPGGDGQPAPPAGG